ncbi:MAG: dihydropyrimidinase [Anaerolineae bacterium]|nr:dihydropyrimidinase [Anaerolineae bacterium]
MARLIIQGGNIVSPDGTVHADLLIENEKIAGILAHADPQPEDTLIDASGLLVLPGIIDAHTHIQLDTGIYQTADNWEIGSKAAAAGGVTTVIDFANQLKDKPFADALAARQAEAVQSIIDYAFHMVILEPAHDLKQLEDDLESLLDLGITSLKLFTTYRPNYYLDDAALWHIFQTMPSGMVAMVHCENDSLVTDATQRLIEQDKTNWAYHAESRPEEAEIEAVNRVMNLATLPVGRSKTYIAHCSTSYSVFDVKQYRDKGYSVYCETCPQYLLLDDSVYAGSQPEHYILQPPLRSEHDRRSLREFVQAGMVDVISTDTCDYNLAQKQANPDFTQTPGGLPGIETLFLLMYTLFCDKLGEPVAKIANLMTVNPARIFGLYPRKGILAAGSDADVVLYDPLPESTISHKNLHYVADYSPYEGMRVKGKVRMTLSRGEIIYRDGEFLGKTGRGRFIHSQPYSTTRP